MSAHPKLYRKTMENLSLLETFYRREGHSWIPSNHEEQGKRIGLWASNLRQRYHRGDLSPELIAAVDERIPDWEWRRGRRLRPRTADAALSLLERYAERHQPLNKISDNTRIAGYSGKACIRLLRDALEQRELTSEQTQRLFDIAGWDEMLGWEVVDFHLYIDFVDFFAEDFGHARIPLNYTEKIEDLTIELGKWAKRIRRAYHKNHLPPAMINRLEQVPHWTWHLPPGEAYAPAIATIEERQTHVYTRNGIGYLVDPEHHTRLSQIHWHQAGGYAAHRQGGTLRFLQREVLNLSQPNLYVRFRNRNPRDCRADNLKIARARGSTGPRPRAPWQGTSRFRGVSRHRNGWQAVIRHPVETNTDKRRKSRTKPGKLEWIGQFKDEITAAITYDERAKEIHGDAAILNFAPQRQRRPRNHAA